MRICDGAAAMRAPARTQVHAFRPWSMDTRYSFPYPPQKTLLHSPFTITPCPTEFTNTCSTQTKTQPPTHQQPPRHTPRLLHATHPLGCLFASGSTHTSPAEPDRPSNECLPGPG